MRLLEGVAVALQQKEPALLVGETGTGKTTLVQRLADQVGFNAACTLLLCMFLHCRTLDVQTIILLLCMLLLCQISHQHHTQHYDKVFRPQVCLHQSGNSGC